LQRDGEFAQVCVSIDHVVSGLLNVGSTGVGVLMGKPGTAVSGRHACSLRCGVTVLTVVCSFGPVALVDSTLGEEC
jgi:hypothetical protein